jgi:predicted NAD/FAD-binding protein
METDWMNDLQHLPSQKHGNLFATINPLNLPSPAKVLGHYTYTHPVFSTDTLHALRHFRQLNAQVAWLHRAFAGAWMRYGSHEDGFTSGMRAAVAVPGVVPPFPIADADALLGEPCVGAMVFLFDLLDIVQAFVTLLVGRVLLRSWQQKAK